MKEALVKFRFDKGFSIKTAYICIALGVSERTESIPSTPDTVDTVVGKSVDGLF